METDVHFGRGTRAICGELLMGLSATLDRAKVTCDGCNKALSVTKLMNEPEIEGEINHAIEETR